MAGGVGDAHGGAVHALDVVPSEVNDGRAHAELLIAPNLDVVA